MATKRKRMAAPQKDNPIFGDLTEEQILKPVVNKDVPASADVTNLLVISPQGYVDDVNDRPIGPVYQNYGDILEFSFPQCEQVCNLSKITPQSSIATHHIFDIDCECEMKAMTPILETTLYVGATDAGKTNWRYNNGDNIDILANQVDSLTSVQNQFKNTHEPLMVFVVSKQKQKLLGDWIQEYSWDKAVSGLNQKTLGGERGITNWLFDRFCAEVKPMYARYCYWIPDSKQMVYDMVFTKFDAQKAPTKMIGADQSPSMIGGKWKIREFHRRMDQANLTPSDSYANKLILGSLGSRLNQAQLLGFKIYSKAAKVNASTLYFQQNEMFQAPALRGSRKEYGASVDWGAKDHTDGQLETLTNAMFRGVVTCSMGNLEYFDHGKLNKGTDPQNVLQETATGTWY